MTTQKKRKIINDPVYGFINLPDGFLFKIIEHPYLQRLRRIKQLGLAENVYPGAVHTRFQHTLGAVHLMGLGIDVLRSKGHIISREEEEAASLAILLHDIGHSPYSHSLEKIILPSFSHEELSEMFMRKFNRLYPGRMDLALAIFRNQHEKSFLHQLVSSQLDVDRLDYLKRDSFYTGVSEGVIGSDRIIKMMNVVDDTLVIEAKGIYSIEKFLIARWLMYWQVYLHKTVVGTEQLLLQIIRRVKVIIEDGHDLYLTPLLHFFFREEIPDDEDKLVERFAALDDSDILVCIKEWIKDDDKVLQELAYRFIHRKLFAIKLQNEPFDKELVEEKRALLKARGEYEGSELDYFVFTGSISNNAYSPADERIQILFKDGNLKDIADASDMLDISVLSKVVKKYFLCYPKEID